MRKPVALALLIAAAGLAAPARGEDAPPPAPATPAAPVAPAEPAPPPVPAEPPPAPAGAPASGYRPLLPWEGAQERPLSLEEAARLAVARNLELAAAAYDPWIACAQVTAAEGAFDTLLTAAFDLGTRETPQNTVFLTDAVTRDETVGVAFGASRRFKDGSRLAAVFSSDRLFTTSAIYSRNPSWTGGVSLEYARPLLRGAGDVATADIRRARNGARAAQEGLRAATEDVLLRVEQAYWNLVFARAEVASRRKSEELAGELLEQTKARYEARVATVLDLADARAGVESRRGDRIVAEGATGLAEDALRALVLPFDPKAPSSVRLVPTDLPTEPPASEAVDPVRDADRFLGQAPRARPELRVAEAEVDSRGIDVETARDAMRPQLDLVARLSTAGLDGTWPGSMGETLSGQALGAAVGLQFSVYVGRRTARANLDAAEWGRRQAALRMRELENRVVQEVRAALRQVATARARVAAAREEVSASREALEGEQLKERNGESTPFRVLEKEDVVRQAELRENRAAVDVRIATARVWRSVGLLAEVRKVAPPQAAR